MAESELASFSRLEASITQAPAPPRPMSNKADAVFPHAKQSDFDVNEFDFNFDLLTNHLMRPSLSSLHDVRAAIQAQKHCLNINNFSQVGTHLECFSVNGYEYELIPCDAAGLRTALESIKTNSGSPRLLILFVQTVPSSKTSYGVRTALSLDSVKNLFSSLELDPTFVLNVLGRPDYWAPRQRLHSDEHGNAVSYVNMKHYIKNNSTVYIIVHKPMDTVVSALRRTLENIVKHPILQQNQHLLTSDPLDIHVMLANLSFEASKFHVKRFQRFMWAQFDKVDEHFYGQGLKERNNLEDLTKELQVISYNADSHTANASIAIINAESIRHIHRSLHGNLTSPSPSIARSADAIEYIISSMEKQKMWFLNYKNRKDVTMSLVYNLVTQQDAANNMSIAVEMRKDSSSMSSIAALTMFFLPGTFTASLLGAGIFSAAFQHSTGIKVSQMWWLWVAITVPLTTIVMLAWYMYQRAKVKAKLNALKHAHQTA